MSTDITQEIKKCKEVLERNKNSVEKLITAYREINVNGDNPVPEWEENFLALQFALRVLGNCTQMNLQSEFLSLHRIFEDYNTSKISFGKCRELLAQAILTGITSQEGEGK